ncbi:hypothetical protein GALMADRAFT_928947 [Galerina marginata CBS 339.88]|uniref:Uncharacterized protein n=1 Tax=Galerina marginata (strain CBS 339.88) TaxID=685588 RepID=A0A067SEJ2_GALM3|nr:hypothetical protein GALMADRAFT_928947 [Galerina marginata CBS 339.88]
MSILRQRLRKTPEIDTTMIAPRQLLSTYQNHNAIALNDRILQVHLTPTQRDRSLLGLTRLTHLTHSRQQSTLPLALRPTSLPATLAAVTTRNPPTSPMPHIPRLHAIQPMEQVRTSRTCICQVCVVCLIAFV